MTKVKKTEEEIEIDKEVLVEIEDNKKFGKAVFTQYIDTKCLRQLFLKLGRDNSRWIAPFREITKKTSITWATKFILNQGRQYEQKVYKALCTLAYTSYKKSSVSSRVVKTHLTKKTLLDAKGAMSSKKWSEVILLEHQFDTPQSFLRQIFPPKIKDPSIPVNYSNQRPDIIILRNNYPSENQASLKILSNGLLRIDPIGQSENRCAINILDVKNISAENIGKKQFIEILYYMWAFSYFLKENKLDDEFFVIIDDNGIFPHRSNKELMEIQSYHDINENSILIQAKHTFRLFQDTLKEVSSLWNNAPCPIESTLVNIQQNCGYCPFLEDCKETLGMNDMEHPENWSLKLIPYTSPSIAQQLESYGMKTVGDVAKNIASIPIGNTPEPLYPELPLLGIRAKALRNNALVFPKPGQIHTYTIPRFTPISLTIALETDPSNERVFAFALYLEMSVAKKAKNFLLFKNWWTIWKDALTHDKSAAQIKASLNSSGFTQISLEDTDKFKEILPKLKELKICLEGDLLPGGKPSESVWIHYQTGAINQRLDNPNTEVALATELTKQLFLIFELCNIIEQNVIIREKRFFRKIKEYVKEYRTEMGVFYWSSDQLEHLQSMLERNLAALIHKKGIWDKFSQIISWFTPSESEITHAYRHKKLYDLKIFTETVLGFPGIMNYTWHEIWAKINDEKFSPKYWLDHFNYMDYRAWHTFLEKKSGSEDQKQLEEKIKQQMYIKVQTINKIRKRFQKESQQSISWHAAPKTLESYREKVLPLGFHNIGRAWYFFSKLTGSMEELEAENFRTIYPEFSIGKLVAAVVSKLQIIPQGKGYINLIEITGLSSNMKLKLGDRLLLIPEELRDMRYGSWSRNWVVIVEDFRWVSKINGYIIRTEEKNVNFLANYRVEVENPSENPTWYLYPTASDSWTSKLYGNSKGGLLEREHFGESWLGERLSYLWDLGIEKLLSWPASWHFMTPAIYLYFAPALAEPVSLLSPVLSTPISPRPDKSQELAIREALNHVIYAIQGPPGTGKSQTIAALVDEFYQRAKSSSPPKPVRILVTSFSYAAIRVIIKKIRVGKKKHQQPTDSSRIQLIFLRSESQDPIGPETVKNCRDVDDLVRRGGSWRWNDQPKIVTKGHLLEEQLEDDFIIFGNAHQLFHLTERVLTDFTFDLIVVDEASQMPVDQIMSALQFVNKQAIELQPVLPQNIAITPHLQIESLDYVKNLKVINPIQKEALTKLIIVGDHNQLPPVQPIDPPKNLERVLNSLFSYYVSHLEVKSTQLEINYRSHSDIVSFTKSLGFYEPLKAADGNAKSQLVGDLNKIQNLWVREVLDPEKVVTALIHTKELEIGVSPFEAKIVADLVLGFYRMQNPQTIEEETRFWKEQVGVVAPHNAQGRFIIQRISELMIRQPKISQLDEDDLRKYLRETVYSVEKFQGSDRQLIITSIGLSDGDQLNAEDEFIYDLNRFNVLTSRAKNKIVYVCSEAFLKFIPKDTPIMKSSFMSYKYAFEYCNQEKPLVIPDSNGKQNLLYFRWKSHTTEAILAPFSSLTYECASDGKFFSIKISADDDIKHQFQAIPPNLVETIMSPGTSLNKWTFKLNNIDKIHTYVPISAKLLKEVGTTHFQALLPIVEEKASETAPNQEEKEEGTEAVYEEEEPLF